MEFTKEEINEFVTDCNEMLESAELELLNIQGTLNEKTYNAIFRAFHSIKGGAGMFSFNNLQQHLHTLESEFIDFKSKKNVNETELGYFLKGIDIGRQLLIYISENSLDQLPDYQELGPLKNFKNPAASTESNELLKPSPTILADKNLKKDQVDKPPVDPKLNDTKILGTVYCVDDEQDILEILQELLESANFKCETFLKPSELYKRVSTHPPDVIITDFRMPDDTGLKVLEKVKKIDPEIQVIMLSGFLEKSVLVDSLNLGLFSAIEKPFTDNLVLNNVLQANNYRKLIKSFSRSINLMLYQFSELDEYLVQNKKDDVRKIIREELSNLLFLRKELRKFA